MSTLTTPAAKRLLGSRAPGSLTAAELQHRVNSYNAAQIAGTNDYAGILGAYLDMQSPEPRPLSAAQVRTGDAIPRLLRHYLADNPRLTAHRVGVLLSRTHDWLAARPTALTSDGGALIVTTTRDDLADPWFLAAVPERHRMPSWMRTRALHDLLVTGLSHVTVVCEIQGHTTNTVVIRRIRRVDRGVRQEMRDLFALEQTFYQQHVLSGQPPEPNVGDQALLDELYGASDPEVTVTATPQDLRELRRLVDLERQIDELRDQTDLSKVRLKTVMGPARVMLSPRGTRLLFWSTTGNFAYDRFASDHPDVAAEHRARIEVLDIAGVTAAHPDLTRDYWVRRFHRGRSTAAVAELAAVPLPPPRVRSA
jgi:hypothetical protein